MRNRERTNRSVTLALLIVLPLFVAAFDGKCDGKKNPTDNTQAANTQAVDDQLRVKIREDLTAAGNATHQFSAADITINVLNQKVTLTGTVKVEAGRAEAARVAGQVEITRDGKKFKAKEVDASQLTVVP